MTHDIPRTGLQLRSLVKANATLELSLVSVPTPEPAADEVLVRIEAAPINPSDLALLFGAADMSTARVSGTPASPVVTASIPEKFMRAMAMRVDQSLPVGNEGAGLVARAGSSPAAQALLGKLVAAVGGAMYSQYRSVKVDQCTVLPAGTTPAEGASAFVNPLTALGMVETMRREGHKALVHTAAASNLGQMLVRVCLEDGVALVNIVRKKEQADLLRKLGAVHVCDSSAPSFMPDLIEALVATGATIGFDATGGGKLAGQILACMEDRAEQDGEGLQPLRLRDPQAGLPLRRPRPQSDRAHPQLRHGLGNRRLAPHALLAEDRPRRRVVPEGTRGARAQDHVRQHLLRRGLAGRGAAARRDERVRPAGHRREVPRPAEQGLLGRSRGPQARRGMRSA